jgi:hypothetical protein
MVTESKGNAYISGLKVGGRGYRECYGGRKESKESKESTAPGHLSAMRSPKHAVNPSLGALLRHPCLRRFGRAHSRTARAVDADLYVYMALLIKLYCEDVCYPL